MPEQRTTPARTAVLADSDTRWKWGAGIAGRLHPNATVHGFLLRGRATPTPRQLAETGVSAAGLREVTTADFLACMRPPRDTGAHGVDGGYDAVVLACVGGTVQAMLHGLARLWPGTRPRPVVVTGYVGVVYEKLVDGLLLRHGADMVLANSPYDADRFRAVYEGIDGSAGSGASAGRVVPCALPFLGGTPYDPAPAERGERPYRVVFAAQPSVPEGRRDRGYLLGRALDHAHRNPDREVVLKLRSLPGEHTTHIEDLPYQRLLDRLGGDRPSNLQLRYGHMGTVLDGTDLLVTVSSTAALESLHRGIPTAVLTDLGVRESLGNHYFVGSGCLASWDQLDDGHLPRADPGWLAAQGITTAGDTAFAPARERLHALLRQARENGLPSPAPYYSPATAPGYLPGVLARYGLDVTGEPLDRAGSGSGARAGAGRRLLRAAARGTYRAGVQRVAPLIRRWGHL